MSIDQEVDIESYIERQRSISESLERTIKNYKKDSDTRKTTLTYYNTRLAKLNDLCAQFRKNDEILVLHKVSKASKYVTENHADAFEEAFVDAMVLVEGDRDQRFPPSRSEMNHSLDASISGGSRGPLARLGKIQVPTFDGTYTEWPGYSDLYESLVHTNGDLKPVEKFFYLKGSLKGEALSMIKHLPVTGENYAAAWKILSDHFVNNRELFKCHMNLFFSLEKIPKEDSVKIRQLLNTFRECRQALQTFQLDTAHCDPILIFCAVQKLPRVTLGLWETHIGSTTEIYKFSQFETFLDTRIKTLAAIAESESTASANNTNVTGNSKQANSGNANNSKGKNAKSSFHAKVNSGSDDKPLTLKCGICDGNHSVRKCKQFLELSVPDRRKAIDGKKICFNCLASDHLVSTCWSFRNCSCGARHHTLLHVDATRPSTAPSTSSLQSHVARVPIAGILLSTAVVGIRDYSGRLIQLRALLDNGSEGSFITKSGCDLLRLPKTPIHSTITGFGDSSGGSCQHMVTLSLHSTVNDFEIDVDAYVHPKPTSILPSRHLAGCDWSYLRDLPLADPKFADPAKIDLLLGADVFSQILRDGIVHREGMPTAMNTTLGWVLNGLVQSDLKPPSRIQTFVTKIEVDRLLRRFWDIEEPNELTDLRPDEKWCAQFYEDTISIGTDDRYVVRLPFKTYQKPDCFVGRSYQAALRQFSQLERKFSNEKHHDFYQKYVEVMQDYISQGHMELVSSTEQDLTSNYNGQFKVDACYLPHHAVIKESSSTTKLRVVFNASHKTSNGKSLNDILHAGPPLHNDLPAVITNWRFHKVSFTGDLQAMFRQIWVDPQDSQFQRILWRSKPTDPLLTYCLKTVTFGTTCAPFLALRTVQHLAEEFRDSYPLAYPFLKNATFVDDIFAGADDVETALEVQRQLIQIFRERKFHLRKIVSNYDQLLEAVQPEDRELPFPLPFNLDDTVKTLGIRWQPNEDTFGFHFEPNFFKTDQPITKRNVLSTIARLFDPLGFISPVILKAKLFMRDLWRANLDWDDLVPEEFIPRWQEFVEGLHFLPRLKISRWLGTTKDSKLLGIHGFCDASLKGGYGAAIYLVSSDSEGVIHSHLLTSKAKPGPTKTTTLPRLELLGAELLAKMMKQMITNWKVTELPPIFAWSDSQIVLWQLEGDPNEQEVFVANRVTRILDVVPFERWNYIESERNPADPVSRGLTVLELVNCHLFWHGPTTLFANPESWLCKDYRNVLPKFEIGLKRVHVSTVENNPSLEILQRFSSYNRLIRVTARIQNLFRSKRDPNVRLCPNAEDIHRARKFWVSKVQEYYFADEVKALRGNRDLPNRSSLLNLHPFVDGEGILRVRGRLENSNLSFSEKFPMILPKSGHFTLILIRAIHDITLHGGNQLVLNHLQKQFYVISGRVIVRSVLGKCLICCRLKAKPATQLMGVLPQPRVTPSLPFTHVGIDFAGVLDCKASDCRGKVTYKGYFVIFVCFVTRAFHLEVVGDLSTKKFLAAMKRFYARRPNCTHIYSDNGTNFVGAVNLLKSHAKRWRQQIEEEILPYVSQRSISWHFIPPATPHFGGLWEAGVKSVKYHLKRVCGNRSYTFEEWTTFLAEIEGILNSRPLCPKSSDPGVMTAITPHHFLNGDFAQDPPPPLTTLDGVPLSERLRELSALKQSFWRQWSKGYLSQLQSRPKWLKTSDNMKVDDLVLVIDDRLPPLNWLLARVLETHPGPDGLVRVVTLRTQNGVMKRPIHRVCRLPLVTSSATHEVASTV